MYLKSLELQGFKSFPDKIRLNFDKGLTAVVGPNGSGKSNIGDAVRWVLGEQSTKMLRGNKMEDVIFSGTVGRKPTGFAAVTLVIDNSENRFEGCGDEVSITRKLYRSGDSEYRINGKAVRLKDINELFMDTGLGRDGYSIIGQGRIAEIVGAKSTERREIFEEAAGISKFRYRKTEAERKLAQTQEKMERVQDIFQELESRIEPLRIQAQKAEKYLILAKEEKQLEVSVWVTQLEELQTKLKSAADELLTRQTEYENAERRIQREDDKIQDCYQKMQEYSILADEAHAQVRQLRSQAEQAQTQIAVWKNDVVHHQEALKLLESRHEQDLQEHERLISGCHQAEQHLHDVQKLCNEMQSRLEEAGTQLRTADTLRHQEEQASRQAEETLTRLSLDKSELGFSVRSAEEKVTRLQQELTATETGLSEMRTELQAAETRHQEAVSRMNQASRQAGEQKVRTQAAQEELQKISAQKQQAEEALRQIGFQLQEKKQRHRILTDLENHMEGFSGSVKSIMKAVSQGKLSGISGSVAQLIQVSHVYGTAIETALGASVQHIIVEDENAAKAGMYFLRDNRAGRATFLPLTTIKARYVSMQDLQEFSGMSGFVAVASDLVTCDEEYRQVAENLLGRILIAETVDTAAGIARQCGYRYRVVTMDGQVINAGGSFTGGSVQKTGGMLTRKTELNALQTEIQHLALQCQEAEQNARQKADMFAERKKYLASETETFSGLQETFLRMQTEAERLSFPLEQLKTKCRELSQQRERLKSESVRAEHSVIQARQAYDDKLTEISQAEEQISVMREKQSQAKQEYETLSGIYNDLKISLVQDEKDREAAETALRQAQEAFRNAEEREQNYLTETKNSQNLIAEKQTAIHEQEAALSGTERDISEAEQNAKKATQQHDELNIQARQLQSGLNTYYADKEKLSAEMTRLSEKHHQIQSEYDRIIEKLLEVYEMTRSEAQESALPIPDMAAAKKRLAELKQKIRALGSVNLDAVSEYEDVSTRYQLYSKEIADIRKAKQELEKIIQNLTSEMCRIFSESFRIINQNFKEIFQDLFGGGRAELILTEPEQVLTSGIEISVAPPGKVIKNLISLSGGEQSFVAIAIYFAILKLRPAPFCILDEIDAALDEANVRKYARYLKKFTEHTQFVLVTHRRSAMEEANILYGVTMQEDGISRLLKLEQPEEVPEEYQK